jgi:hypothetical protein
MYSPDIILVLQICAKLSEAIEKSPAAPKHQHQTDTEMLAVRVARTGSETGSSQAHVGLWMDAKWVNREPR